MRKSTKRELAISAIVGECAKHGHITQRAIDLYLSNRISREVFMAASRQGIRMHSMEAPAEG